MMQDPSEPALIFAAEIARQRFRKRVTDRVRMTKAFALDDLDFVVIHSHG
jgi:hypothetical protein